jgi:response regulator RpfG family c-di-GMP phosphodiesterase
MNTLARILLVDDEPHVLDGLRRTLRNDFAVETATGPAMGLERIREAGPFAVLLSDYQMPQMNGAQFLAAARAISPDTSRLLLTGQADLAGAASAINTGGILRMLLKPAGRDDLVAAINAGVEQYRLVTSERDLLENTLRGSVRALMEVLALASPTLFERSTRLRNLVTGVIQASGAELSWYDELAAMLAQVGAIAIPWEVLQHAERGDELDAEEQGQIDALPGIADRVLAAIPRIDQVREAILSQDARYDGQNPADPRVGDAIPLGGRALRVARDFDALETSGAEPHAALWTLRTRQGSYDPKLIDALAVVLADRAKREPQEVLVAELLIGMVLAEDVSTVGGIKLVSKGHELTVGMLERIHSFAKMASGVDEPIHVYLASNDNSELMSNA